MKKDCVTKNLAWKSPETLQGYAGAFAHLRDAPVRLLELGIHEGGSLRMWRDFFPKGQIVGLDINPSSDVGDRIRTFQGPQQDVTLLARIAAECAPDGFDIIIDDAAHVAEYAQASFWYLFRKHLRAGGIYVIEDWATGYDPQWTDGRHFEPPAILLTDQPVPVTSSQGIPARARRAVRVISRPVSRRLERMPGLHGWLRRTYLRADALGVSTDYPSHSAGMVGFVKQLVDASALNSIIRDEVTRVPEIAELRVSAEQVFCFKRPRTSAQ